VRSAAASLALPVGGGGFYLGRGFIRPGRSHPIEGYTSGYQTVTPGYFGTLGVPLLKGRDFDSRDTVSSQQVAIINRTFAERFFAGENPIGQQVLVWKDEQTPREIIGVVDDLKPGDLTAAAGADLFVPNTQSWMNDLTLVIRTDGDPAASAPAIKAAVEAADPSQAVYDVKTFDSIMRDAVAQQRFSVTVFAAFAALALTLAAVGLYGVMTHVVNARAREMGVRLALGARPSEVRALVVRQALVLLGLGLAIGIPASLAAARLLGSLLYGVGAADPITFAAVTAILAGVAYVSAALPAARVTRIDPSAALRSE
jgi:predicted permease